MSGRKQLLAVFFALHLLLGSCVLHRTVPESLTVRTKYHSSENFSRIPEYFSGKEYTGSNLILRSSEDRTGIYFYLPTKFVNGSAQLGNVINLQVVDSTGPQFRSFDFIIPSNLNAKKQILLGLTGKDWKDSHMRLVAWKIEVTGPDQKIVFAEKSSLWSH